MAQTKWRRQNGTKKIPQDTDRRAPDYHFNPGSSITPTPFCLLLLPLYISLYPFLSSLALVLSIWPADTEGCFCCDCLFSRICLLIFVYRLIGNIPGSHVKLCKGGGKEGEESSDGNLEEYEWVAFTYNFS